MTEALWLCFVVFRVSWLVLLFCGFFGLGGVVYFLVGFFCLVAPSPILPPRL